MTDNWEKLSSILEERGLSSEGLLEKLRQQRIATPSWGYSDSGTRFKVFKQPGAARNLFERLEDAAQVNLYSGIAPEVAVHIPWDKCDDYDYAREFASELGLKISAVNPNLFQDDDYKLGSLCNEKPEIRKKALSHIFECIDIGKTLKAPYLSLWLADGTNYPGQGHFRRRKKFLSDCLRQVYDQTPSDMILLLEYKFFEPAFYHTDVADWGIAYIHTKKLGERAKVLVDLGHHSQGTNIEWVVAVLVDEGKLGGFHFNDKKYADDDLTVSSINPYELFLIYNELVDSGTDAGTAFMIDQSPNLKPKIEAIIQSVLSIQKIYVKALTVDRERLREAQEEGNIIDAESCLVEAFETDISPLIMKFREEVGYMDPIKNFRESGYLGKIIKKRSTQTGI